MADERIIKRRAELRVKIARAKLNYLSIGFLTLVNILLNLFGAGIEIPFYLSIPYSTYLLGRDFTRYPDFFGAMIMLFAVMVTFLAVYILLFLRTRKADRVGALLVLILIDTVGNAALIALLLIQKQDGSAIFTQLLNLAFHFFVIGFLESGRRAAYGLTVLPDENEDSDNADNEDSANTDPDESSTDSPENPAK